MTFEGATTTPMTKDAARPEQDTIAPLDSVRSTSAYSATYCPVLVSQSCKLTAKAGVQLVALRQGEEPHQTQLIAELPGSAFPV